MNNQQLTKKHRLCSPYKGVCIKCKRASYTHKDVQLCCKCQEGIPIIRVACGATILDTRASVTNHIMGCALCDRIVIKALTRG